MSTLMRQPENGEIIPMGDERKLVVEFYHKAIKNGVKSETEGRPIHDELVFVTIAAPGDRNNIVDRKARDEDKERFPRAWQRFEQGKTVAHDGTPIDVWPPLSVREVADLKAMNIFTVEHVAELHDGLAGKHVGLVTLRDKARAYLAAAKDAAFVQQQASELQKRDEEIAALKESLATMNARLEEFMAPKAAKAKAAA